MKVASHTPVTAAIGDGANDVSMIQEAHVGLGNDYILFLYATHLSYLMEGGGGGVKSSYMGVNCI